VAFLSLKITLLIFSAFSTMLVKSRQSLILTLPVIVIAIALLNYPVYTFAVLLFLHNLIAFIFWWRLTPDREDKRRAAFAGFASFFIGLSIALGFWDRAVDLIPNFQSLNDVLSSSNSKPDAWAKTVMPFLGEPILIERWVSIAAFGQLMHYHVWLYSIPRVAVGSSSNDYWSKTTKTVFALSGMGLIGLAIVNPLSAKVVYLAVSAAHGFAELGTLALLFHPDFSARGRLTQDQKLGLDPKPSALQRE
jgi:hypothetical protein